MPDPAPQTSPRASTATPLVDYGWRLRGRAVGVLQDRSFNLHSSRGGPMLAPYCADVAKLAACLQCGTCTATCNLSEDGSLFPRREMHFVQLGQRRHLINDPLVWTCYNCTDCSDRCPSNANPGLVLAAIRRMSLDEFAVPRFMARALSAPAMLPVVLLVSSILLATVIGIFGSFQPQPSPVLYSTMLPHASLNLFFFTATAIAVLSLYAGLARAWRAWTGDCSVRTSAPMLRASQRDALSEVLAQRRFTSCAKYPLSRAAHIGLSYGFMGLLALAGVAALAILVGAPYPFPARSPLKVFGNIAALALVLGSGYFLGQRLLRLRSYPSTWHDWVFLGIFFAVGLTGLLTEVFRWLDVARLAYPTYFVHLVVVFVLLVGLPWSKFSHVAYRTLALAACAYTDRVLDELFLNQHGRRSVS